jgi:hypothetical protein
VPHGAVHEELKLIDVGDVLKRWNLFRIANPTRYPAADCGALTVAMVVRYSKLGRDVSDEASP